MTCEANRMVGVLAGVCLAIAVALTGCTPGQPDADAGAAASEVPRVPVDDHAAQLLPDAVKSSGVLKVGIPTNEPPTQYYAEGTQVMTGVNPDIARLIGQVLGLKVEIQVANFDSIIPGMAAGRYDLTVSSMTPTRERLRVLDFVDYMKVGNAIAVSPENPQDIRGPDDLCGTRLGLLTGSYQLAMDVPEYDKACAAAGKPAIQTHLYQDTRQAISALTSGRLDAILADSPIIAYAATQNSDVKVGSEYQFQSVAVGVSKDFGLLPAVEAAMDDVVGSPAYHEVLEKYGLESQAIKTPRVNFAQ